MNAFNDTVVRTLLSQLEDVGADVRFFQINRESQLIETFNKFPVTPPMVTKTLRSTLLMIDLLLATVPDEFKNDLNKLRNRVFTALHVAQSGVTGADIYTLKTEATNRVFKGMNMPEGKSTLVQRIHGEFDRLNAEYFITPRTIDLGEIKE